MAADEEIIPANVAEQRNAADEEIVPANAAEQSNTAEDDFVPKNAAKQRKAARIPTRTRITTPPWRVKARKKPEQKNPAKKKKRCRKKFQK
ncbi:hypothetical protein OROHE_008536 [Orobanche hederae]